MTGHTPARGHGVSLLEERPPEVIVEALGMPFRAGESPLRVVHTSNRVGDIRNGWVRPANFKDAVYI